MGSCVRGLKKDSANDFKRGKLTRCRVSCACNQKKTTCVFPHNTKEQHSGCLLCIVTAFSSNLLSFLFASLLRLFAEAAFFLSHVSYIIYVDVRYVAM